MILDELEAVVRSRIDGDPATSYTAQLLANPELAQRKVMEEAFETCLELGRSEIRVDDLANEAADVVYHLMVALVGAGVSMNDVYAVLEGRRQ